MGYLRYKVVIFWAGVFSLWLPCLLKEQDNNFTLAQRISENRAASRLLDEL
jgi:hypothetical protein